MIIIMGQQDLWECGILQIIFSRLTKKKTVSMDIPFMSLKVNKSEKRIDIFQTYNQINTILTSRKNILY